MDIRAARRAAGLTQSALARAAGVSQPNLSAYENGRRTPSPEVLARIERALRGRPSAQLAAHRDTVRRLVSEHHAAHARVVGSVARGQDEPGSDLDILVEFTDEASLLDEVGLRVALTEVLQVPVDVIALDTLRGPMRERFLTEAIAV